MSSNTQLRATPPTPPPIRVDRHHRVSFDHDLGENSAEMLRRELQRALRTGNREPTAATLARWRERTGGDGVFDCPVEGHPNLVVSLRLTHSLPAVSLSGTLPAGTDVKEAQRAANRTVNQVLAAAALRQIADRLKSVVIGERLRVPLRAVAQVEQIVEPLMNRTVLRAFVGVGVGGGPSRPY